MKRILLATTALALSSPVFAADLTPAPMPVKAPVVVARPFSWSGCYIGGHVGGDFGHANFVDPNNLFNLAFPGSGLGLFAPTGSGVGIDQGAGFVGGGQIGCDYQFATNWVAGVAGDFSWTNLNGSTSNPYAFFGGDPFFGGKAGVPATLRDQTDWLASVTGRIGYAWDRWMLYGKGGVAWEHSRDSIAPLFAWGSTTATCVSVSAATPCVASGTDTDTGWTLGVGLTWAFADNWSAGIEYDHYGFGNHGVTLTAPPTAGCGCAGGSASVTVNQNIEVVKATLDYRFNWFGR